MYQIEFNIITLLCIGTSQHGQYHAKEAGSDSLYCTGVFLLLLSSEDNSKPFVYVLLNLPIESVFNIIPVLYNNTTIMAIYKWK